jgi:branched-chain amino acid transport system permease protein
VFGLTVSGERDWYWVAGGVLLLSVWLSLNLIDSPLGRALRAVHGSEAGAEAAGIDSSGTKVLVFVISAMFASVAGSLFAHKNGFITPDIGSFLHSVELVTMVVLGGMASTFGALVGAVILTLLPQVLASFEQYEAMILGAIMMGTMIFLPKGLLPSLIGLIRRGRGAR